MHIWEVEVFIFLIGVMISSLLLWNFVNVWYVIFEELVDLFLQKLEPQELTSSTSLKKSLVD